MKIAPEQAAAELEALKADRHPWWFLRSNENRTDYHDRLMRIKESGKPGTLEGETAEIYELFKKMEVYMTSEFYAHR